jgi:hypothetical protein
MAIAIQKCSPIGIWVNIRDQRHAVQAESELSFLETSFQPCLPFRSWT